ncbi:hypothetical protein TSUD_118270 [Trifolium subterraneum]|uniref:Uncharacterized protein n=1 Tax=Trifolium subterraneum TaxID=3900 RepID=A0A2Z6MWZ0_TRISU|nr:hypothetical protein TSUD_118270 [Trifolium subterraneum]
MDMLRCQVVEAMGSARVLLYKFVEEGIFSFKSYEIKLLYHHIVTSRNGLLPKHTYNLATQFTEMYK